MSAWEHDHSHVVQAFGDAAVFVDALSEVAPAVKLPPGRPRTEAKRGAVQLYRGVEVPPGEYPDVYGISWTFERDIAAWFAVRFWRCGIETRPFVFSLKLKPRAIVAIHNERGEAEAIIHPDSVPSDVMVDIDQRLVCDLSEADRANEEAMSSWLEAAERHEKAKNERGRR
jgi:hypothetical protein